MARACSICSHLRVAEIDAALLKSVAYRSVAKLFGASKSSVYRHSKEHLPVAQSRDVPGFAEETTVRKRFTDSF